MIISLYSNINKSYLNIHNLKYMNYLNNFYRCRFFKKIKLIYINSI